MAQFRDLRAQRLFQVLRAAYGTLRDAQLGRRFRLQHRGKSAALRDIDDLFLRNPTHGAEAILGRDKTHHRIKWLAEDAPVWTDNRKLMHRKTCHRLHHPRLFRIAARHRLLQSLFPLRLLGGRAQHDAGAAIGAVGFQDQ